MPASWALSAPYFLALGFLSGVVGFRVGWRLRRRPALPLIQALFGWSGFILAWSNVGPIAAAMTVLAWAAGTTLVSVYVFVGRPRETDALVVRAAAYREGMLDWLQTGRGPESSVGRTVAQHVRETIWYLAAAVLTANLASIALGALLLNYMNAYVATLLRASVKTPRVLLLAWNVWSVVRVVSYVLLGAAAANPVLRWLGRGADPARILDLALAGAAGLVLDLLLKLALARRCARALAGAVDLDAARAGVSSGRPLALDLS